MKWAGVIGFSKTVETATDVWTEEIIERSYHGDLLSFSTRWQNGSSINDDLNISNKISILCDPYINNAIGRIKYATFMGTKWKVNDISVQYPRLVLSLGGVYNE